MSFQEAIRSVFTQYVGFTGRARRREYWYFALLLVIVEIALQALLGRDGAQVPLALVGLATLLPSIAVGIRRLHDTDRSGWWLLLGLVPFFGWIVLLVFFVLDGTPGSNKYGPSPKAAPMVAEPA